MKNGWTIALGFLLLACGNNKQDTAEASMDTLDVPAIVAQQDSTLTTEKAANWLGVQFDNPAWKWSNLELEDQWQNDSLPLQPFNLTPAFLKDFHSVLRWAPDSSALLDIGSYGSVVVADEDGTTHLEGGEPDTEISVIFPKSHEKARLLFAGPSSVILNATWLTKTEAIIAGSFASEADQQPDTLVWLVDVRDRHFRIYNYKRGR